MTLTPIQKEAFDRIVLVRQLEQRTGIKYGQVERKVLADLHRDDVIAVVDALREVGRALAGFDIPAVNRG